jgi:broad specificity phosphatase PhoE
VLPEEIDMGKGWWDYSEFESKEDMRQRAKKFAVKLKEIAIKEDNDYTLLIVSHSKFLSVLIHVLLNVVDYFDQSNYA